MLIQQNKEAKAIVPALPRPLPPLANTDECIGSSSSDEYDDDKDDHSWTPDESKKPTSKTIQVLPPANNDEYKEHVTIQDHNGLPSFELQKKRPLN
jgi:hypothetical protein